MTDTEPGETCGGYTVTVQMTGSRRRPRAPLEFRARLAAGSHRNTGNSPDGRGRRWVSRQTFRSSSRDASPGNAQPCTDQVGTYLDTTPGPESITYTLNYQEWGSRGGGRDGEPGSSRTCCPSNTGPTLQTAAPQRAPSLGDTITWDLGSLAPGATGSKSYQVVVSPSATNGNAVVNNAEINSAQDDANFTDNRSSVTTTVRVPAISGSVLNDLNGNMSDDDGGAGIAGASVNLYRDSVTGTPGGTVNVLDATDILVGTVTTDASGSWTFEWPDS